MKIKNKISKKKLLRHIIILCFLIAIGFVGYLFYGNYKLNQLSTMTFDEMLSFTTKDNKEAIITVGIIKDDKITYSVYGENGRELPKEEHIYEIGSITKTFTASLICKAISDGKIALGDSISEYVLLPKQDYYPTIQRLLTHTSGYKAFYLEKPMVSNFFKGYNDFNGITKEMLIKKLEKIKLDDSDYAYKYSNFGMATLGLVLERVYDMDYTSLMSNYISFELGLTNTRISNGARDLKNGWEWSKSDAYMPAGALLSNISDMLLYLKINMDENPSYLSFAHEALADVNASSKTYEKMGIRIDSVGAGWMIDNKNNIIWHNGATGNYNSYIGFDKDNQVGVVVLSNLPSDYRIPATIMGIEILTSDPMRIPTAKFEPTDKPEPTVIVENDIEKKSDSTVTVKSVPTNEPKQEPEISVVTQPEEAIPGISNNYLILLETEAQIQSARKFKEYKEAKGYTVTVKSIEKDVKPGIDEDKSETIHQFLKDMDKERSLDYVLLIGEPYNREYACPQNTGGIIPMRYMYANDDNHNTRYHFDWYDYKEPSNNAFNTPTDIYYAFNWDWDYDKDGFTGELIDDISKYYDDVGVPELLFYVGRIPFSDSTVIESVLDSTVNYDKNRKEQSNALIGAGIIGYPEKVEFPYIADGAYYANILSNNLSANNIETVTLYEKSGVIPSKYECTYPLNYENFDLELNKLYDFTFIYGHGGYTMFLWTKDSNNNGIYDEPREEYDILREPVTKHLTGFLFMDGCHTMRVEEDSEYSHSLHIQDILISGMSSAGLATTREGGYSPENPRPSISSNMFLDKSLIISKGFYEATAKMIFEYRELFGAYIYCYLGDPSIRLRQ
ncbi:MAG: hypothetical protein EWM47_13100 [Anaerolineaceae bacterium]|nr:MAG: hypothetical protein EWM47_13100 [Anaerolineaceae bacterium]